MTKSEFITAYIADGKGDLTSASKAWDASEFKRSRAEAGSPSEFYSYLREAPRTVEEAETFLKENGSDNMYRSKSFYLAVARLVADVRADLAEAKTSGRKAA